MEILDSVKIANDQVAKKSKERRKLHDQRKQGKSKKVATFNDSLNKAEKFRNMVNILKLFVF